MVTSAGPVLGSVTNAILNATVLDVTKYVTLFSKTQNFKRTISRIF